MKYFKIYETLEAYNVDFLKGIDLPNTSYIRDIGEMRYTPSLFTVSVSRLNINNKLS